MQAFFQKILKNKRQSIQLFLLIIVLASFGVFFRKNIVHIFASTLDNSRPTWCTYDYTDDLVNNPASGWWKDVRNYYSYKETEKIDYSFNLVPIKNWATKIDVTPTYGTKGILVNRGSGFTYQYGSLNYIWVYSFNGEPIHLKIYNVTTNATNGPLGPVYKYDVYYKDNPTPIQKTDLRFVNSGRDIDTADPVEPFYIDIDTGGNAGAYRIELLANFQTSAFKPDPGYPISFGYSKQQKSFPRFSIGVSPYFFVPANINKIYADLKILDTNEVKNEWVDPYGARTDIDNSIGENKTSGEIVRKDDYTPHAGGALVIKDTNQKFGAWKIDVSSRANPNPPPTSIGNGMIEQLYFYNIPNAMAVERQYLMVPEEKVDLENSLCKQLTPFQIDEVVVENSGDSNFDGTYQEVLMGPDVPTDLMPSTNAYPNWRPGWNGKKNELAIYRKPNSNIYIVKTISKPFADSKGYYLLFDTGSSNPSTNWYRFKATSTDARWLSNDAPLQNSWQKATGTWAGMDASNGWQAVAGMKVTSISTPTETPCP